MTSFELRLVILCLSLTVHTVSSKEGFVHMTKFSDRKLSSVYSTVTEKDYRKCCLRCEMDARCVSTNHHPGSSTCQLSDVAGVLSLPSSGWTVFTNSDDWQMVFRATPYIGTDVAPAWINGDDVTDDVGCTDLTSTCTQHFRHPSVDNWSTLPIKKVKYALYQDGKEVAFVVFDGTNSLSVTDWFTLGRVLDSSWTDLQGAEIGYFDIQGDRTRRFFIHLPYSGCPSDIGYTAVVTGSGHPCDWDQHPAYPTILYATGTTSVSMNSPDLAEADTAAIFIR